MVSRLQALTEKDVLRIREVFVKYRHTRFVKSFSYHLPFGTRDAYVRDNGGRLEQVWESHRDLWFLDSDKSVPFLEFYKQMRNRVNRRH